jgi:hypothetical protein
MKLKVNDIILVHGFVMLKGLKDGQKYRVQSMPDYIGIPTYQFTKAKGKKVVCRHHTSDVDIMIQEKNLNRIEVL